MTSAPRSTLIEIMAENTDDHQQVLQMTAKMQQYHLESVEITKEFDHLLTTTDQFKVSLDKDFEFKLQDKSFKIHQTVSRSSNSKKKNAPKIWYVETVCPGSPHLVHESFSANFRKKWDANFSSAPRIEIDNAFPNIYIQHTSAKGGGLISPRDFLDLVSERKIENKETGYQSIQTTSKSISHLEVPKQKGFVRANVVIGGLRFETLSNKEIEEMELPKLMVAVNEESNVDEDSKENTKECQWTRIQYLLQWDLGGWLPKKLINSVMADSNSALINELRNFVIEKRLGLC